MIRLIAEDKFSIRTHFSHGVKNFIDIHDGAANLLRIFGYATCHDFFFFFVFTKFTEKTQITKKNASFSNYSQRSTLCSRSPILKIKRCNRPPSPSNFEAKVIK